MVSLISSIEELIQTVELADVTIFEESFRRTQEPFEQISGDVQLINSELSLHETENSISYKFRLKYEGNGMEAIVDIGSAYISKKEFKVDREVALEFASKVAFMIIYPYVRSSIWSGAARLRLPAPLLGLIQPGALQINEEIASQRAQAK